MFSTISTVASGILACVSIGSLIFGKYKALSEIKEGLKALLRNSIEKIYYSHLEEQTLREYERKNLDSLAAAYFNLKGNSFVTDIYEKMRDWTVIK